MSDDVWPKLETGPNEHEERDQVEREDVAAGLNELREQQRIGNSMIEPFGHNRVPVERKSG